jgi:4'-phosphopantetheinyl transferase
MSRPSSGRADVWFAYPGQVAGPELAELRGVLSPGEKQRETRFYFERDRVSFLVTRALLRSSLSRYVDVPPAAWEFALSAHGKPRIASPALAGLHFNVSHARGLSLCIVADHEVGIDVENVARGTVLGVMHRSFSPQERADVLTRAEPERSRRFFEYWTVKEAYAKARGLGLALPFDEIGCRFDAHGVNLRLGAGCDDDAGRWQVRSWAATPVHVAAAVVGRGLAPLQCRARWGLPQLAERPFQSPQGGD